MKIEYIDREPEIMKNFLGGEKQLEAYMYTDDLNRILKARLVPGASIGEHKHETSSEIIYIIEGSGKIICDGVEEHVSAGDCHYCPKGSTHTFINDSDGDTWVFAVVPKQ